jgi:hypothetical protein
VKEIMYIRDPTKSFDAMKSEPIKQKLILEVAAPQAE